MRVEDEERDNSWDYQLAAFNRIYNTAGAGPRRVRGNPKRENVARSDNSAPSCEACRKML